MRHRLPVQVATESQSLASSKVKLQAALASNAGEVKFIDPNPGGRGNFSGRDIQAGDRLACVLDFPVCNRPCVIKRKMNGLWLVE